MVRIKKSDNSGPWNKVASTNANEESSPEKEIEANPVPTKTEEAAPSGKKSYVPPHMRGGGGSSTTELERRPMSGRSGRSGKNAPDLNAINFPSLSDSAGVKDGSKGAPRSR